MARVLEIAEMGREVLRRRARRAVLPASAALRELAASMVMTMEAAAGVGIAAPQVFRGVRAMIVAPRPNERYPHAEETPMFAAFNPEIAEASAEVVKDWEGCLSVPGLRGLVPRHRVIRAVWRDADGKRHAAELRDFAARVFQHELDHLDGILFLDRMESVRDLVTEKEFGRILSERGEGSGEGGKGGKAAPVGG